MRTDPPTRSAGRRCVRVLALALSLAAAMALAARDAAAAEKKITHIPGSRFTYIHRLPLIDSEGKPVKPDDELVLPFSYRTSCNKCHEYDTIRQGWHFNATDPKVPAGRPGQPWFWIDPTTGTQIPITYRDWPNTWRPGDVGMTPWKFVQTFGRQMPGGGPGEETSVKDPAARWLVSGKLEINCGSCHSGDPTYDHVEWFIQVASQNFMWAGAATTDLAAVSGAAASMPPSYDPFMGADDERMAAKAPAIKYNKAKLDAKGRAFFDLPSSPPDDRCYFCHNNVQVGPGSPEVWQTDQDLHLAAGLSCSDCHRNGLNHMVSRNYEGEPSAAGKPQLQTLTCRGCHLGAQSAAAGPDTTGGRLGAPVPKHVGLPTIHLERLACTTCHSGLYPGNVTARIQTSRAHALEFQGPHRGPDMLPLITEPVFVRQAYDGKIAPQRMAWPAFWARIEKQEGAEAVKVTPLGPDVVYEMAKDAFDMVIEGEEVQAPPAEAEAPAAPEPAKPEPPAADKAPAAKAAAEGDDLDPAADEAKPAAAKAETPAPEPAEPAPKKPVRRLTTKRVIAVLAMLAEKDKAKGEFGYVTAGQLYRLADGQLAASEHPAAAPASWPIAHNVRGAGRALGVGGCTDCHSSTSPIAFGQVAVESPANLGPAVVKSMFEFQGRDPLQLWAWSMSYQFRPMFKVVGFATAGLIAAVLTLYLFMGLAALARWASKKAPQGPTA